MEILTYRQTHNIKHWDGHEGNPYGDVDIKSIDDSSGAKAEKPITSIPSPFARIDLVNTAFAYCADHDLTDRKLNTVYDKIVSDTLDVGLLFFKSSHVSSNTKWKIDILRWERQNRLEALKKTSSKSHKLLARTLELYLDADKEQNNFDELDDIFFLLVDGELTGSTSPKTMFMPSSDPVTKARGMKLDDKDHLFDENYCHLHQRIDQFQQYLYFYFNVNTGLKKKMEDFYRYVEKNINLSKLRDETFSKTIVEFDLKTADAKRSYFNDFFVPLALMSDANCEVKALRGVPIHGPKAFDTKFIEDCSDFVIKTERGVGGKLKPLVLANGFAKPYKYTLHPWDSNTIVRFNDPAPLSERVLPGLTDKYPYLTAGDFLEPSIIEFDYRLNKEGFFVFGFDDDSRMVIPPLTKTFFQYFSIEDVLRSNNGQPMITVESSHKGYYRVKLNIPVRGGCVTFERAYEESLQTQGDKGRIVHCTFDLNIFPHRPAGNHFRVAMLERTLTQEFRLGFYNESLQEIDDVVTTKRASKQMGNVFDYSIYGLKEPFNYIGLEIGQQYDANVAACLALKGNNKYPKGQDEIVFGVDFGTTNTHIEYRKGSGKPKPFELNSVTKVFSDLTEDQLSENTEFATKPPFLFMPKDIKAGTKFRFPQRTVIGERNDVSYIAATSTLGDVNIPFSYEKDMPNGNSTAIKTNLKWSGETNTSTRIGHYLEELCLLMYIKVLEEGGNIEQTKILYSYPSSMNSGRRAKLNQKWEEAVKSVFGPAVCANIESMSEGIAPFYYYTNQTGTAAHERPVLSVDIGGGTTDVTMFKSKDPQWTTSFKFAGNALFGDSYGVGPERNGFLYRYAEEILSEFGGMTSQIFQTLPEDSADRISFLFSLESNEDLNKGINPNCFFSNKLKNDGSFKFVFILFYSAIVYHIAQIMKGTNASRDAEPEIPSEIVFSGTASKVLGLIDMNADYRVLSQLTEAIFAKVYGVEPKKITVKRENNPKEVTSKGLIYALAKEKKKDLEERSKQLPCLLLGTMESEIHPLFNDRLQFEMVVNDKAVLTSVMKNVETFFDTVMEIGLSKQFFKQEFDIERSILKHEAVCNAKAKLHDYLVEGIIEAKTASAGDTELNETLFFYPVRGMLGGLAYELSRM